MTVDLILFVLGADGLEVPLIRRARDPYADRWALPGGFVDQDEDLAAAARREMLEETGVKTRDVIQVGAYGEPGRDPRGHSVGVGFMACGRRRTVLRALCAGDDAAAAELVRLVDVPPLAFDHDHILHDAWRVLQREAVERALVFDLLPTSFEASDVARALTTIGPSRVTTRAAERMIAKTPGITGSGPWRFSRATWRRATD